MGKSLQKLKPHVPSTDPNYLAKDRYIHIRVSNAEYLDTLKNEAEAEDRTLSNYVFCLIDFARREKFRKRSGKKESKKNG